MNPAMFKRKAFLHLYTGDIGLNRPLIYGISSLDEKKGNFTKGISLCFFAIYDSKNEIDNKENEEVKDTCPSLGQ